MSQCAEFVEREYTEYELRVLYNLCSEGTWCDKHLNINKVINGIPCHNLKKAKKAVKDLKKIGLIAGLKKQGREDYCMPKTYREEILLILGKYEDQYSFIQYLEFIR
jgi:hypothetical protein